MKVLYFLVFTGAVTLLISPIAYSVDTTKTAQQAQTTVQIEQGEALYQQGLQYIYGLGNESIDLAKAATFFEQARKVGNADAIARLADMQLEKDNKTAYFLSLEAEEKGSGLGALVLGEMYHHGWYVPQDENLAEQYFKKAFAILQAEVNAGKHYHLNALAYMYDLGYGVAENIDKAKVLYRQAANSGNAVSKRNLAELYKIEVLTEKKRKEMFQLFLQAAEKNEVDSQYEVGEYYVENGEFEKGVFWLKKAAEQGLDKARLLVANLSLAGLGTAVDVDFALSEFEALEDYYTLGYLYELGTGVPQDLAKALHYYELFYAKKQDDDESRQEEVLEKITQLKEQLGKK
ncbi:tetratricopeptide repeat protein [Pasteurella oralis]|uniref:tetratricopeptide repeat protein n=1 Tax=Pasteurella oralis TaxID=1071947 RepID=UPI000C7D9DDF|nr:tetratricopeptide repeat protein [Pasteurella oralis]